MARVSLEFIKLLDILKNVPPQTADAIVWLQGDCYDRADKVISLFWGGFAPLIVISGNNELIGAGARPGENNISLKQMSDYLLKNNIPPNNIIVDDRSFNTAGQAKNVIALACQKNWQKIILVASLYHQPRAFLTFLKAKTKLLWKGYLINQSSGLDLDAIPAGHNAKGRALIDSEIKKIEKYQADVAPILEGISYLK